MTTIERADVCVVGAGASGLAAAVSAARYGARVLLVERSGFLGGLGTGAAMGTFCGMYTSGPAPRAVPGWFGRAVVGYLSEVGATHRSLFGATELVHYDPDLLRVVYDRLTAEFGVRVLGHSVLVEAARADRRVESAIVATPGDPRRVEASVWIDASGDAVLCHRLGVPCRQRSGSEAQPATLVFRMAAVDIARGPARAELNDRMRHDAASGRYDLPRVSGSYYPTSHHGEVVVNMTRVAVDGTDADDLTRAETAARRQVYEYARWLCERVPGFEKSYICAVAPQLGIRETRRLVGRTELDADWLRSGRHTDHDLGYGGWPFELHDPRGAGTRIEWLPDDTVYAVPADATRPPALDNLWAIGRCLSATPEAHASTRVMGTCFSVGEGAGAAAADQATHRGAEPRWPTVLGALNDWRRGE